MIVPETFSYEAAADKLNQYIPEKNIRGLILQADEAVLVENRLKDNLPIVDEVRYIDRIPEGKQAAIEVALPGTNAFQSLWNRYAAGAGWGGDQNGDSHSEESGGETQRRGDPYAPWKCAGTSASRR